MRWLGAGLERKGNSLHEEDGEDVKKCFCEVYEKNGSLVGASEMERLLVLNKTIWEQQQPETVTMFNTDPHLTEHTDFWSY